ncbi:hypothetical protein [Roseomonas indoligenes]|uniref:Uncharacterized protein n=1 Tax=Roseomonas indoligenes TaxID=2820811 RepID=A0A940N0R1_9PROT|nr:hypothetical protein [Pararoseomonas indoligenes]MBP0495741.1 hypothetical protein [Pararoseomonas indoligenes]
MPSENSASQVGTDARDSRDRPWQPTPEPVDWLWNVLTVGGPAEQVEAFRSAAAGPGVVPWVLDLAALEEEFLLPMAAPQDGVRAISLAGAKILARRLRDAAAANHQAALARMATDRSCPFDLHRLLPVPSAVLALGPEEGVSREWLRTHWGVRPAAPPCAGALLHPGRPQEADGADAGGLLVGRLVALGRGRPPAPCLDRALLRAAAALPGRGRGEHC